MFREGTMKKIIDGTLSYNGQREKIGIVNETMDEMIKLVEHWKGEHVELTDLIPVEKFLELQEAFSKRLREGRGGKTRKEEKDIDKVLEGFHGMSGPVQFPSGKQSSFFRKGFRDVRKSDSF